jgi:hypothetical protein
MEKLQHSLGENFGEKEVKFDQPWRLKFGTNNTTAHWCAGDYNLLGPSLTSSSLSPDSSSSLLFDGRSPGCGCGLGFVMLEVLVLVAPSSFSSSDSSDAPV